MKRIALVLMLLALFTSHRSAAACGPLPGNGDVTTLFWGVLDYSDATRECLPWQPCWPGRFARAKDLAARHPDSIPENLVYQAMVLHLGPEDQNALLDRYLKRAKAEPANPKAQYLAAQVAPHAAEQLALLDRAVKLDPSLGPAYLDLAHAVLHPHPNQSKKDLEREHGTVETNLARFMRECPQYPGAALQLNEVGDVAFWKRNLPEPRQAIEAYEGPRGLWRHLDALGDLWALEKRLYPRLTSQRTPPMPTHTSVSQAFSNPPITTASTTIPRSIPPLPRRASWSAATLPPAPGREAPQVPRYFKGGNLSAGKM